MTASWHVAAKLLTVIECLKWTIEIKFYLKLFAPLLNMNWTIKKRTIKINWTIKGAGARARFYIEITFLKWEKSLPITNSTWTE